MQIHTEFFGVRLYLRKCLELPSIHLSHIEATKNAIFCAPVISIGSSLPYSAADPFFVIRVRPFFPSTIAFPQDLDFNFCHNDSSAVRSLLSDLDIGTASAHSLFVANVAIEETKL